MDGVLNNIPAFCTSFGRSPTATDDDIEEAKAIASQRDATTTEMARLAIDFKAAQLFFNLVK